MAHQRSVLNSWRGHQLVCRFDPEPVSENSGYIRVINLALRDDHEGFSEGLGIEKFIDLGFIFQGKIHLPNGDILNNLGSHRVLWVVDKFQGGPR